MSETAAGRTSYLFLRHASEASLLWGCAPVWSTGTGAVPSEEIAVSRCRTAVWLSAFSVSTSKSVCSSPSPPNP